MQAIVQGRYGSPDVLEYSEVDKPAVGDNDVLVRVHAAGVNAGDWHLMRGKPYLIRAVGFGLRKPKQPVRGLDVAGRVEAVGKNVEQFAPGDDVFGFCQGAFAEYAAGGESRFAPKPANLTFEQAAAVPIAAFTAIQAIRDHGKVQPGQSVLINGAAGGVGTFSVQIAKAYGAEVTGVCSTRNVDMVRSIGADHVIDYTREDFASAGKQYDVMVDIVGNRSVADCRRVLRRDGTLVLVSGADGRWIGGLSRFFHLLAISPFISQKMRPFISSENKADLLALKELIEAGKITPEIDRTYPLPEVPDAMRYIEESHARGKVVIHVKGPDIRAAG